MRSRNLSMLAALASMAMLGAGSLSSDSPTIIISGDDGERKEPVLSDKAKRNAEKRLKERNAEYKRGRPKIIPEEDDENLSRQARRNKARLLAKEKVENSGKYGKPVVRRHKY